MPTTTLLHPVRLKPPFYQAGGHCGLHRYLDAEFVNRFKQDVQRSQFNLPQFGDWQQEERHSRHGQQPVLRLPLHRAFHIVSCEVVCDRFGEPALDSNKVTSAGFVIRRVANGGEQAWLLEDGEALGWQQAPSELRDPDLHRRLCANGVLHKREDQAAYSGEDVHPLHVLKTSDTNRKTHTLLFGYLPLGGFYYQRDASQAFDSADQAQTASVAAAMLPWPFGYRQPLDQTWRAELSKPLAQGRPSPEFFELLRTLINRYHLGEAGVAENAGLASKCQQLWLYDESQLPANLRHQEFNEISQGLFVTYRRQHLFSYLQACFARAGDNPLVSWVMRQEQLIEAVGGLDGFTQFEPLPNANSQGSLNLTLLLLASDAQEIRTLLGQRLHEQTLRQVKEMPLPKFGQNPGDVYQVVPFVRFKNEHGQEQIQWANADTRSIVFRVAAPFDPEASRPALIQMPSLADLRRGLAKGAAMITPADTFDLMNKLKLNKGASEDTVKDTSGPDFGIQWICSFSLPVITLVAMILLMIMISLLNIVFFWLPWVRICLPFPKIKGG